MLDISNSNTYLVCDVTVIIPAFNAAKWILKALASIENQILKPSSIIIVDDGSTDETRKIIESYTSEITTTLIAQKNKGPAAARNLGVKSATTKYVAFLDADDEWELNKLETQFKSIDEKSFSTSNCFLIDDNSKLISRHINDFDYSEIFPSIFLGKISMLTPGLLIPRDAFIKVGGFDETQRYKEDHLLILALLSSGLRINYEKECLFSVRVHEDSGRNNFDPKIVEHSFTEFKNKALIISPKLKKYENEFDSALFFILSKGFLGNDRLNCFKYACLSFSRKVSLKGFVMILISTFPVNKKSLVNFKRKIMSMKRGFK